MDRFTSLPPELIDQICSTLHDEAPNEYLGLVHRAFLPSSRRQAFRNSIVLCGKQARRLLAAVTSEEVGSSVHKLWVLYYDLEVEPWPESSHFAQVFPLLANLQQLHVQGDCGLVEMLMSWSASDLPFLELEDLSFTLHGPQFDPSSLSCLRVLASYSSLQSLVVMDHGTGTASSECTGETEQAEKYDLPQLDLARLGLHGCLARPAMRRLISICPRLVSLWLDDGGQREPSSLITVFDALPHPEHLQILSLSCTTSGPEVHSSILAHTPNLQRLFLERGTWASHLLASVLRLTNLVDLTFSRWLDVCVAELDQAIPVLCTLPYLREVQLNNLRGREEPAIPGQPAFYRLTSGQSVSEDKLGGSGRSMQGPAAWRYAQLTMVYIRCSFDGLEARNRFKVVT
ncbi:hypothetical protein JCM11251_003414 [Rhodosporidiobolus azoricus]